MGKHTITKFWLKPESQRKGITDSLLLESGVEIFSAVVDGKYDVFLRTCGDVRIVWKDVSYRNRASFPDDLVEGIRNHNFYHSPDAYGDMNNWYEIFVYDKNNNLLHSDVYDIDIDTLTEDDAKGCVLDTVALVVD